MVRRILVVEDERRLAELVKAFLADKGYAVLVAYDGEKGVETALREKPAVVLSDVLLPKLNGWDLCRRIKAEPALAATRVILMTAVYTKARYRTDAAEAGADDFVPKPLDLDDLAVRIGRLFHLDRPPAVASRPAAPIEDVRVPLAPPAPKVETKAPVPRAAEAPAPVPPAVVDADSRARRSAAPPESAARGQSPPPAVPAAPAPPPREPVAPTPMPHVSLPKPSAPRRQEPHLDVDATLAGLAPKPRAVPRETPSAKPEAGNGSDFDLHLAAMRRRFAAGLPATLARIERTWVAAAGGCEQGPWEELAHVAHDLAGSAGSFGLPAVGDAARELEESVRTHLASGVPIGGKARASIKQYVERLGALIHLL